MTMALPRPHQASVEGGAAAAGHASDELIEEQGFFERATQHGLLVNLLLAGVALASLWPNTATAHLIAWSAFMLAALAVRLVLHRGFIGATRTAAGRRHWRTLVVAACVAIGAGWGWLGFFLFPAQDTGDQVLVIMVLAVAVATVHTLAPLRKAAAAFLLPAVLPTVARLALFGGGDWGATAALLCVLMCFVWWNLLRYHAELAQRIRLHFQQEQSEIERATYVRSVETANRLFAQVVIEREQAEAELNVAKQAAEEANRAKSEFLAYTSHEIRTPLNAIIGLTRAVMDSPLAAQQRDYLRRVRNAGERLLALINDLLDMSKIEAGKLEIERVDFRLREVLDEVVHEQMVKATEKGLAMELEVAREVPDYLVGDPLRLRQILVNLLGNAIKFTEKGSVTVRVALAQRENDASCVARLSVIDTGIGILPEKQATLFQRYTQAESSTSRKFGGTGLGLAISKSLVELMSGTIGLRSEVDKGTEFYFELPFEVRSPVDEAAAAAPAEPETAAGHAPRILVAEDNEDNQLLIELLLRKKGIDFAMVDNGREALNRLDGDRFDLVLMDLEMPGMGGFEAVAVLRERESGTGRRIPVVALSAHALVGYREKCLAAGMDDYLTKPIDPDTLYATIDQFARRRPAVNPAPAGAGR
jgi:signal transduction histidine kinase/ActR/RegA family two-component response regulator